MNHDTPDNTGISPTTEFNLDDILAEYRDWKPQAASAPRKEAAPTPKSAPAPKAAPKSSTPAAAPKHAAAPASSSEATVKRMPKVSESVKGFINNFSDEEFDRLAAKDRSAGDAAAEPVTGAAPSPEETAFSLRGFRRSTDETPMDFRLGEKRATAKASADYTAPKQEAESVVPERKKDRPSFKRPAPEQAETAAKASGSGSDAEDDEALLAEFPSFGEFIKSGIHNITTSIGWFFANVSARIGTFTVEDPEEETGPEARPADACAYYHGFIRPMHLRLRICYVLLVFMAWLSFRLPVTGYFKDLRVTSLMCMCFQLTIMLACCDTFTTGILNAVRKRPGAESLAALFCLVTTLDAFLTGRARVSSAHVALCLLSSLSLVGVTLASFMSVRALHKSYIIPKKAASVCAVTSEFDKKGNATLRRTDRSYGGFIRRSEEAAPDETNYIRYFLPAVCSALFFTLIVCIAKKNLRDFFYIYSVILCPTIPFTALLCFAWPYFTGAFRAFRNSSCIAGWSGVCDIGHSKTVIITDADLFPGDTVSLGRITYHPRYSPKQVLSYAGTLLMQAGTTLAVPFMKLMQEKNCVPCALEALEPLPCGALKGVIDGSVVVLGTGEALGLLGIKLRGELTPDSIGLAVNGTICGCFQVIYRRDEKVRKALSELLRSTRHPVFAPRDFNITPQLLSEVFELPTGGYDFPPYLERYSMTERDACSDAPVTALLSSAGLSKVTRMAETGHAIYTVTRINLLLNALAGASGMLVFFIKLLGSGVSVAYMFVYLLLWALPVAVLSFLLPRI